MSAKSACHRAATCSPPPCRWCAATDRADTLLGWLFDREAAVWLGGVLRPRLRALAGLFALGLVAAATGLVPPYLTKLVIDEGLLPGNADALVLWCAVLFGVGLASLGLGAASALLHMRASVAMLADLRAVLARRVLERSPAWRARHQTGELLARLDGDAGEVQQFAFTALLTGSGALVRLVGGAAMLFVLNWQLAVIACLLAPAELAFFAYARPRTQRLAVEARTERGHLAARFAEMLGGMGAIQSAAGEPVVRARLADSQGRLNRALLRAQVWGEVTRGVPMILTAMMRVAIFLTGGLMVIREGWPLGSLIAFVAYLGFLIGPMQSLIGLWHAQARMRAALGRLAGIMAPEPMVWPAHPSPLPAGAGLCLQDVAVEQDGRRLVSDLTVRIPAGAKVRIAGDSGIGKSSLLALLQRHGDPAAGRIMLGGTDLRDLGREDLRRAVRLVPQRPFLMRATVAENLRLSAPGAPDPALTDALDAVCLGHLDPGMTLGEDGITLSGGERQRLCLARALLSPGRVLILDEALSEVDPPTVRRIIAGIDTRLTRTTRLIATHGGAESHGPFDQTLDLSQWQVPA